MSILLHLRKNGPTLIFDNSVDNAIFLGEEAAAHDDKTDITLYQEF